ncbi:MAG: pilus assembly protein PilM [Acetomicrobium sp.]|nr:pilus assembly protein PilM [Acetomicrobium sp.]
MKRNLRRGISITGEGLRYVELEREGRSIKCNAHIKVYLSQKTIKTESIRDTDSLYAALRKLKLKIGRFGKIKAAFGIPIRDSHIGFADFPGDMDFEDVKKSLYWQLEDLFPISGEKAYYDIVEIDFPRCNGIDEKGSFKKYLVAASGKDLVDKIMEAAMKAGFLPSALEPVSLALTRTVGFHVESARSRDSSFDRGALCLFPGDSISMISLNYRGNDIFYRPVMVGRKTASENVIQSFIKEIKFTLDYLYGFYPWIEIDRLFLVASDKFGASLKTEAQSVLNLVTVLFNPWDSFSSHERPKGCGWEASLGLALRDIV